MNTIKSNLIKSNTINITNKKTNKYLCPHYIKKNKCPLCSIHLMCKHHKNKNMCRFMNVQKLIYHINIGRFMTLNLHPI